MAGLLELSLPRPRARQHMRHPPSSRCLGRSQVSRRIDNVPHAVAAASFYGPRCVWWFTTLGESCVPVCSCYMPASHLHIPEAKSPAILSLL